MSDIAAFSEQEDAMPYWPRNKLTPQRLWDRNCRMFFWTSLLITITTIRQMEKAMARGTVEAVPIARTGYFRQPRHT